jgi:aminopeptidase N
VAGNGALDAASALQDFDGISYAKGAAVLRQLNENIGDEAFFAGVIDLFRAHRYANASMSDLFASWAQAAGRDLSGFAKNWLHTDGLDTLRFDRNKKQLTIQPPSSGMTSREHKVDVLVNRGVDDWATKSVTLRGKPLAFKAAATAAVLVDPGLKTWADVPLDAVTLDQLADVLPETADAELRAGIWSSVRSTYNLSEISPTAVIELLSAALPTEDLDTAFTTLVPWALQRVKPHCPSAPAAREAVLQACLARLETAPEGSPLALAAAQGAISSGGSEEQLRAWLAQPPSSLYPDVDFRWRIYVRLAEVGWTAEPELKAAYRKEPTSEAQLGFLRAHASLAEEKSKQEAWAAFIGEREASNYELEALGQGFWSTGLSDATAPYLERYFDDVGNTAKVRSGWVLASVADDFFPHSVTNERLRQLCAKYLEKESDPSLRRAVSDALDDTELRLTIAKTYPSRS